jgi:glycosyltransferase involved in cell wall biosynthesis
VTDLKDRPTVTVVIPCFNQARFLPAAVASVRAQRYPCLECIVVNDGSTDDSAAVASTLGVHLVEQPNRGVSQARNAGLSVARSDFVVFLDADDELLRDAVALGVHALRSNASAVAVVGRCQVMDAAGYPLPAVHNQVDASKLYQEWLSTNFVWTLGAAMFRARALEEIGGFPIDVGPAADYAIYLRLARTGRVTFIAEELARYRQHDTSMSRDPSLMLTATLAVLKQERRDAPVSSRRWIRRGRRSWCDWYGEQIVDRLRTDWHAGQRGRAQARAILMLIRHCPRVAVRHLARKGRRVLGSLGSQAVAPVFRLFTAGRRRVAP